MSFASLSDLALGDTPTPVSQQPLPASPAIPGLSLLTSNPQAQAIQAEVAQISSLVSPWLWVFSVAGFLMAFMNTRRVDAMWKRHGGTTYKGLKKPKF